MVKEINQLSRETVKNHLEKISSFNEVYELFKLLNYPDEIIYSSPTRRKKDSFNFKKEDQDRIKEIYSIISVGDGLSKGENLQVFLVECNSMNTRFTRDVTKKLTELYRSLLVMFTENYEELLFILPENVKEGEVFKLKLTRLHTVKSELYYTDIDIISRLIYEQESNWRFIFKKWKDAFSVERVQDAFFEDYKKVFFRVRDYLRGQKVPKKESHEFTLQLLNRIMFIYFISKKGWLREKKFISYLWKEYKKSNEKDTFFIKWLKQIFFKAFNDRAAEISGISESVRQLLLEVAPFLNGGLFTESELDKHPTIKDLILPDSLFIELILGFFERYNFTIKEDIPLDQDVAVDPQMIGYVYESLANVADEIYDRNDLGIFYTPSIEVEFMCKRSLVEYIWNNMPDILPKEKIYHLLFDLPDLDEDIIEYFDSNNIWPKLEEVLDNLSIVDPACGSGAFLVGMLNILSDIYFYIHTRSDRNIPDFERKYRIVQRNLYGVDVMSWALHAAELRLWLQLIVESDFKTEELKKGPLLPNLDMNLRRGDSLVQEIGGMTLNLRQNILNPDLKKKLEQLKLEKQKYFESSRTGRFRKSDEIRNEEISIFHEIITQRVYLIENEIIEINQKIIKSKKTEQTFLGERPKLKVQLQIEEERKEKILEKQILELEDEVFKLKQLDKRILNPEEKPFVWDIDFAEIFGDKGGFDIVIGNPPYVRQEMISPPNKIKSEVSLEDKKEYKNKLIESVKNQFHVIDNIDRRSDYYIFFYFHGLSLLNKKGILCFITSNSWLDVAYGKDLQEFLLKYVPIITIYDNPKRSFSHAEINTIIALFGAPNLIFSEITNTIKAKSNVEFSSLSNIVKFIMFKKPYEEIITTKNLIGIDNIPLKIKYGEITDLINNVVNTGEYRAFPIIQEDLLEDGWLYPSNYDSNKGRFKLGYYDGNKWGKFLRSPDIFFMILQKGKRKLVTLRKLVVSTQRNTLQKFDNLTIIKQKYFINDNYPYLSSVKDVDTIRIDISKLPSSIQKTLKEIDYPIPDIISNRFLGERLFFIEGGNFVVSDTFFVGFLRPEYNKEEVLVLMNSTLSLLMTEIIGRKNLGGGLLTIYGPELKSLILLNPDTLSESSLMNLRSLYGKLSLRKINTIFEECGIDKLKPIREQIPNPLPDRAEIDRIVFKELDLSEEERIEVYRCVCELVKQRADKAKSLNSE